MSVSTTGSPNLGESMRLSAVYRESQTSLVQTVTNGVEWTSSNPGVISFENGVAKAVGVETSLCTVSYNGVSSVFYFSVHPRAVV